MNENKIIIFPTDTVYGIGCRLSDKESLNKIYELKGREKAKAIPLMLPDLVSINQVAKFSNRDYMIMRKFWPGELTIVLNATDDFTRIYGFKTIAIRIPNHETTLNILKEYGPMWVTSANLSGEGATNDISLIKKIFSNTVDKIYEEANPQFSNVPSTIIDLTNQEQINVLRAGAITLNDINEVASCK